MGEINFSFLISYSGYNLQILCEGNCNIFYLGIHTLVQLKSLYSILFISRRKKVLYYGLQIISAQREVIPWCTLIDVSPIEISVVCGEPRAQNEIRINPSIVTFMISEERYWNWRSFLLSQLVKIDCAKTWQWLSRDKTGDTLEWINNLKLPFKLLSSWFIWRLISTHTWT